jgi:hypothetical protein
MQHFFERHKKTIVWAIVITFLITGVGLLGLNQAGVFDSSPSEDQGPPVAATVNGVRISREALDQAFTNIANQYIQYYQQTTANRPNRSRSRFLPKRSTTRLRSSMMASSLGTTSPKTS